MKLSLALAVLMAGSAAAGPPTCLDSYEATGPDNPNWAGVTSYTTYDGFDVTVKGDTGTGGALPGGDLLNIRESENGCGMAIEFQLIQNFKTSDSSGVITTGSGISHINVAWSECDGSCGSGEGCNKFESDLQQGNVYPTADGWYAACCVDGEATIKVQYVDGQLLTDTNLNGLDGTFSTCNPKLECISGGGDPQKNADYHFIVTCPTETEPATAPKTPPPPPPPATPEPTVTVAETCPNDMAYMGSTYGDICANKGVLIQGEHPSGGASTLELSIGAIEDMFFDITPGDNLGVRVQNPFATSLDMYVVYSEPYSGPLSTGNARKNVCVGDPNVGKCTALSEGLIEAVCVGEDVAGVEPFAVFDVYFVDTTSSLTFGGASTTVHECCEAADSPTKGWTSTGDAIAASSSVYSMTVSIDCTCPGQMRARQLRGGP